MNSSTTMPLHAAYVLLAHDPRTGKAIVDDTHFKPGLAGAVLLELTRTGALRVEGQGKKARMVATGGHVPTELTEAVERATDRSPKDAVARIGGASSYRDRAGAIEKATWEGLAAGGSARPEEHKVMGLFPTTRWIQTTDARDHLVAALRQSLDGTQPTEPSTPALFCVAHASDVLHKLFPDVPKKQLEARAEELAVGQWGGEAVAKAISDIQGAIAAAMIATTAATVASTTAST